MPLSIQQLKHQQRYQQTFCIKFQLSTLLHESLCFFSTIMSPRNVASVFLRDFNQFLQFCSAVSNWLLLALFYTLSCVSDCKTTGFNVAIHIIGALAPLLASQGNNMLNGGQKMEQEVPKPEKVDARNEKGSFLEMEIKSEKEVMQKALRLERERRLKEVQKSNRRMRLR